MDDPTPDRDNTRIAALSAAVDQLNDLLPAITPYKLAVVDPAKVEHVEKNAHYMPKRTFDQLVANIHEDGNLESLPFCWRRPPPDGGESVFICLSGNHRLDAARAAKLEAILILYTDQDLSRSLQVAKQLAHNAITGKDNEVMLAELWREIDKVEYKIYSGLDETAFQTLSSINVANFNTSSLRFEELRLQFVPAEIARIDEIVKLLGTAGRARYVADVAAFDRFWDVTLAFKEFTNTFNSSTAFLLMIDIVEEWLHLQQLEHNAVEQTPTLVAGNGEG